MVVGKAPRKAMLPNSSILSFKLRKLCVIGIEPLTPFQKNMREHRRKQSNKQKQKG